VKGSVLVDRRCESPNIEARFDGRQPKLIVLHYTGMANGQKAVDWLCNPASKVSCHYLIDVDGMITQMVDEGQRAWHAGVSSWQGDIDINSSSIGIEIQNEGHPAGLPAYPRAQMQRVAALCLDIMLRHGMSPHAVVAHSDVAPGRKVDPGEAFDWAWLAEQGIGQVVTAAASDTAADVDDAKSGLQRLGYMLDDTDKRFRIVLEAFQRRYRRSRIDGVLDAETAVLIRRLVGIAPDDRSV
jgi:N-acetylmuramoyl-L-alanine amidase